MEMELEMDMELEMEMGMEMELELELDMELEMDLEAGVDMEMGMDMEVGMGVEKSMDMEMENFKYCGEESMDNTKIKINKEYLLNRTIMEEEARLYDFVNGTKVIPTDKVPTLGVCQKANLWINEDFVRKNDEHLMGLLLHEALHIYFNHIKTDYPYPVIANIAQDIIINDKILALGYSLPEGGCTYESCDVPRTLQTSYDIYEYLVENMDDIPEETLVKAKAEHDTDDLAETFEGSIIGGEELDSDNQGEPLEEIREIAERILIDIDYRIEQDLKRKFLSEESTLTNIVREISKILGRNLSPSYKRTFSRPRRYVPRDTLLPATRTYSPVPSIAIYIDTSGSMMGDNMDKATTVLLELSQHLNSFKRKYFGFDTLTREIPSLNNVSVGLLEGELERISVGGGTEFTKFHEEDKEDVALLITDCEFSFDFLEEGGLHRDIIVVSISDSSSFIENCSVYQL